MSHSLHVICYGNIWRGDDGFGIHVYRALKERTLPPNLRLYEGGTRILDSIVCFEQTTHVFIVDALNDMGNPGKLHFLTPDRLKGDMVATSSHDFDIHSLLRLLPEVLEPTLIPLIRIIGAEAGSIAAFSSELSLPVQKAVPDAVEMILSEFARIGA